MFKTTYQFTISYRNPNSNQSYDSATLGGSDSLDDTKVDLLKQVNYYASLPRTITEIELIEYCATCSGNGEVFVPYKRQASNVNLRGKNKRCPDCKGKGIPKDIIRI